MLNTADPEDPLMIEEKNTIGCYSDTVWLKHLPKKHSCKKMKDIVINFQCRAKSFRINGLSSEIQYIFDLDAGQ